MNEWHGYGVCKLFGRTDEQRIRIGFEESRVMQTVWLPVSGALAFIDFEFAGFNYEGFEIANHFTRYDGKCQ